MAHSVHMGRLELKRMVGNKTRLKIIKMKKGEGENVGNVVVFKVHK